MKLAGKTAMVTGAARGIGRAIALGLAREGAAVVVCDIDSAAPAAEEIRAAGGRATAFTMDIADPAQVEKTMAEVRAPRHHGQQRLHRPRAQLPRLRRSRNGSRCSASTSPARFCARRPPPASWRSSAAGAIVNIGSISGQRGGAGRAAYGAAKAGVIQLTRVMAVELAEYGIRVNCVSPGPTETEQVRQCHDPATREAYHRLLPLKRYAAPEEIAAAAVFLAGPDSSFMTGHILNADGGFLAAGLMFP